MDVVIPYSREENWQGNELRYCIRSLSEHLEDISKIYIVGYKPEWLINVIHIPFEDTWKRNKDANIIAKILKVCNREDSSNELLFISDDQILLRKSNSTSIIPLWWEDLSLRNWSRRNRWVERLERTYLKLKQEGLSHYNYDTHIPVILDKSKFINIMSKYDWHIDGKGYTINTLYFNNLDIQKIKLDNDKAVFEKEININTINNLIEKASYMGWNNKGLNDNLKTVIKTLFPNKSIYERE
jgi:hypothetical protein